MPRWPENDESLLDEYIRQLPLCNKLRLYRGLIRRFQAFVRQRAEFNLRTIRAWLRAPNQRCLQTTLARAQWLDRYLNWLGTRGAIDQNPLAELRRKYGCRRTSPIARALLSRNPTHALEALRSSIRYGSHLGPAMQDHVRRMRTLGFRYAHECRFLRFDRFLQQRRGARNERLTTLVREYVALAPSASEKLLRSVLGELSPGRWSEAEPRLRSQNGIARWYRRCIENATGLIYTQQSRSRCYWKPRSPIHRRMRLYGL
jgi:hypothetical protein